MKTTKTLLSVCLMLLGWNLSAQTYDLYISDAGNFDQPPWQILRYDQNGENPEVFINTNLDWPQDIVFLEDQNRVLISNLNSGEIASFNATSGEYVESFALDLNGPTRMKVGADSLLYVLQWLGNGHVLRFELDGTPLGAFTSVGLSNSIGLDWDADGNLYVSSYNLNLIRRYDPNGEDLGVFANTNLNGPTNIWFGENGHLYALNWGGSTVSEFDANGSFVGSFITGGLGQAEGISFLENGDLLIGNGINGSVKRFSSDGTFIEDIIAPGSGGLIRPNAIILRNRAINGTQEVREDITFAQPNIGSFFELDINLVRQWQRIEIYDRAGKLAASLDPHKVSHWDAQQMANGMYYLYCIPEEGPRILQKIVVQK
ncbi:MAG: hypothetical protein AAFU60_01245 [Bacteroidota bacterium]